MWVIFYTRSLSLSRFLKELNEVVLYRPEASFAASFTLWQWQWAATTTAVCLNDIGYWSKDCWEIFTYSQGLNPRRLNNLTVCTTFSQNSNIALQPLLFWVRGKWNKLKLLAFEGQPSYHWGLLLPLYWLCQMWGYVLCACFILKRHPRFRNYCALAWQRKHPPPSSLDFWVTNNHLFMTAFPPQIHSILKPCFMQSLHSSAYEILKHHQF